MTKGFSASVVIKLPPYLGLLQNWPNTLKLCQMFGYVVEILTFSYLSRVPCKNFEELLDDLLSFFPLFKKVNHLKISVENMLHLGKAKFVQSKVVYAAQG